MYYDLVRLFLSFSSLKCRMAVSGLPLVNYYVSVKCSSISHYFMSRDPPSINPIAALSDWSQTTINCHISNIKVITHQEIVISVCYIIQLHSLDNENTFLLLFISYLALKVHHLLKMVRKTYTAPGLAMQKESLVPGLQIC